MRSAMFGGSFDPIHLGHLYLLHTIYQETAFRKIFLVPAYINNFKQENGPRATSQDRLAMLQLAVQDYRDIYGDDDLTLIVSPLEIERGGISYTYDTVEDLMSHNTIEGKLGLLMGDDLVSSLDKWYRSEDLKNKVEYIICRRGNTPVQIPQDYQINYLNNDPQFDSSTLVRQRIEDGRDVGEYLSKRVSDYVKQHKLYRN